MKRIDLVRHLESHGCRLLREGGSHSVFLNPATRKVSTVPRHREVKEFLVRKICRPTRITVRRSGSSPRVRSFLSMMPGTTWATLAATALLGGCAGFRPVTSGPGEYRGLYFSGFEGGFFQPCEGSLQGQSLFPVDFEAAVVTDPWPAGRPSGPGGVVHYVRWRAELPPVQRVVIGTPPMERRLRVREVLEARAPRDGECGWSVR